MVIVEGCCTKLQLLISYIYSHWSYIYDHWLYQTSSFRIRGVRSKIRTWALKHWWMHSQGWTWYCCAPGWAWRGWWGSWERICAVWRCESEWGRVLEDESDCAWQTRLCPVLPSCDQSCLEPENTKFCHLVASSSEHLSWHHRNWLQVVVKFVRNVIVNHFSG